MQDKGRKTKTSLRTLTRLYVLQVIYQSEFNEKPWDQEMISALRNPEILLSEDMSLNSIDADFFKALITTSGEHVEEINNIIKQYISDKWDFDRFDRVMQILLRLGACELIFFESVPANVVFNEYIEIAKAFFKKREVSFVNGILNSISKQHNSK